MKLPTPQSRGVSISILIYLCFGLVIFAQETKVDVPTMAAFGKYTAKEHAYSREYKKNPTLESGELRRKIDYAKANGGEAMGMGDGGGLCGDSGALPVNSQTFLRSLSCRADAVVLGTAKRTGAHMLDDESYVYTAYDFKIKEVFRNNGVKPIKEGNTIEVTRFGGFVIIDGVTLQITGSSFRLLDPSSGYVLFLRYVPAADGYMVSSEDGDFRIDGDSYEGISPGCGGSELPRKGETWKLLTTLRNAVSLGCDKEKREKQ